MFSTTKNSFLIPLLSALLAAAAIVSHESSSTAAPGAAQIRGTIRERIQERRAQRGQRGDTAAPETLQIAGLDVAVWPPPAAERRAPLIVFSHGFRGCSTQSKFLMEAIADAGYLVVAPNHKDARCGTAGRLGGRPEERFGRAADWSDRTYADRREDVQRLVSALQKDAEWSSQIDWSRVGLVGHSLGGYTVLGLAGGWPSWRMSSIKAVLALSPYCEPYAMKGALDRITVPVMYQGGTRDIGITPSVKKAGGCYAKTASPSLFVEFEGAGHFAWTDLVDTQHAMIVRYSVAFLNRYVQGMSESNPSARERGVADLKIK